MSKRKLHEPFFNNRDQIKEMANLPTKDTGLDHGTIYISSKEGNHGPRIKFYRGRPGNFPSASITISKNPEIIEDSIGLKSSEVHELFTFVQINKKNLLYIWVHGTELMIDEWNAKVSSLKKITE
jgi:hypothetical protein